MAKLAKTSAWKSIPFSLLSLLSLSLSLSLLFLSLSLSLRGLNGKHATGGD